MSNFSNLTENNTLFLIIDIQEKLLENKIKLENKFLKIEMTIIMKR